MTAARVAPRAVLGLILVAALAWRLNNISFGLPGMYDPDEPIFMITALKLLGEGTFNPGWFGHPGTTTIYLVALIDAAIASTGILFGNYANVAEFSRAAYTNPALLFVPARIAIALIGTACVWLTYALGNKLHGRTAGLIAAALLAFNALHIAWSQVIRTDIHASFFMLLCLLACTRIAERGLVRDYLWAGVFAGFATATKWPAATIAIAIIGSSHLSMKLPGSDPARRIRKIALSGLAGLAALFVASPYIFLDWRTVLANVSGEIKTGHLDHTSLGFLQNLASYLLASAGGTMAAGCLVLMLAGFAISGIRSQVARWTIAPAALLFLLLICSQGIIWSRWVLPILPLLCIFAAASAIAICAEVGRSYGPRWRQGAIVALGLIIGLPTLAGAIGGARERSDDTRLQAVRWAIANIPAGSRVAYEHLELNVRHQPWKILFPVGDAGCIDGARALTTGVKFEEVQKLRGSSPIVDLGHVSPAKLETCRADYFVLAYYDLYLSEADRYPEQIGTYGELLKGGRTVALFRPERGKSGGPVVRIISVNSANAAVDDVDQSGLEVSLPHRYVSAGIKSPRS